MRFLLIFIIMCKVVFATEIKNISSDFTQIVTSNENMTLLYKGNFVATKNDNLAFWNYTEPLKKQIFFSKVKVVIIEPDLEQAIVTSLDQITDLSSVLNEALSKKKIDEIVEIEIMDIKYYISFKGDLPIKITYKDELENSVVIELYNTVLNQSIDSGVFDIKIPQNYDIINY
ncbi:MAG: LolA-like outer membrane lipoprotein chaperone [Campylobacteraceae bacterium]|jgi:outer membrane lipoprotein carrier protein|nr:LolA-like outer membrane lipoprotein chaperone [Campylobacteraceae bacterium]